MPWTPRLGLSTRCDMRAICPKNPEHKLFTTTAHVMEEWLVDEHGNFVEARESLQTDHGPDPDNNWTCDVCGTQARVEKR